MPDQSQAPSTQISAATRFLALDAYRGVAACLVVVYHYNLDLGLGLASVSHAATKLYLLVDFFFALSGFVVMTSYGNRVGTLAGYGTFLRRRLARLYPLHLATLLVSLSFGLAMLAGLAKQSGTDYYALSALPANLLLIQAWGFVGHESFNVPSWSISAEWFLYLVFPVLVMSVRRCPLWLNLALLIAFAAAFSAQRSAAGMNAWTIASFDMGALRALPSFFAGVLAASVLPRLAISNYGQKISWPRVHALFASALIALHFGAPDEMAIALFAGVVLAASLAEHSGKSTLLTNALFQRLGAASYAIYMIHVLMELPARILLRKAGLLGTPVAGVAAIATFIFVLIAADLIHRRFEMPWQKRLSGGAAQKDARAPLANIRPLRTAGSS